MTIDQNVFKQGDVDVLIFKHYTKDAFTYALDNGDLSIIHFNRGRLIVIVKGWDINLFSKIFLQTDKKLQEARLQLCLTQFLM